MSSTSPGRDGFLASFYQKEFLKTARRLSEEGVQLLAADLDGERESYHIRRERTSMEPADFELNLEDMDEVRRWLSDRWQGPGSEALAHLLEKILQLAPHFDSVEEVEDVSPDMYVMF